MCAYMCVWFQLLSSESHVPMIAFIKIRQFIRITHNLLDDMLTPL